MKENVGPFNGVLDCLLRPGEYFAAMPLDGGYGPPLARVMVWAVFGSLTGLALREGGIDFHSVLQNPSSLPVYVLMGTLYQLAATFLSAGVFHVLCKLAGGKAGYQASFRVVAALAVLGPVMELAMLVPVYGLTAMCLLSIYYWLRAALEVHAAEPGRARLVFGLLGLGALAISILYALI